MYDLIITYFMKETNVDGIQRILFLESIAGVPGMVAATLRHLTSLRLMVNLVFWLWKTFTNKDRIET
jgi:Alternative oxidase